MDKSGATTRLIPLTFAVNTRITIGRAADNLITLNDETVSRYNAVIDWSEDGELILEAFPDAAIVFMNGAVVLGRQPIPYYGSVIEIGVYRLTVSIAQGVPIIPPPYRTDF